ncbi:MAG TPA: NirA family protein, partial [Verrucomicrobiae bacterium]|nr:NirA family protein [Verrucomicrobiae bacterium]
MTDIRLPFESIKGQALTAEQRSYLEGLFCGLKERGLAYADVEPPPKGSAPEPAAVPENLIFEERVKRELHPLDSYPQLLEDAAADRSPERENAF